MKLIRPTLPYAVTSGATGATLSASTMICAHLVGNSRVRD